MLRKGLVIAALFLLPTVASAQVRGPWELELSGSGANGRRFDGFSGALNASVGFFFSPELEVAARQTLVYSDISGPATLNASTRVAVDLNIPLGDQNQFVPFVGGNIGYVYGHGVTNTFEGAPEGGLKVFISNDWFLFGQIEYQFFFRSGHGVSKGFSNGEFVYTIGVGTRF